MAPPYPEESWFTQTWIYSTGGCLQKCFSFYDQISFWEKNFKLFFSIYCYANIWPPTLWSTLSTGIMIEKKITWRCFTNVSAFVADRFLRRRFLKTFSLYMSLCKNLTPYRAPSYPRRSRFKQTWIYSTWWCFHTSNSFSCWSVSENNLPDTGHSLHIFIDQPDI